MTAPTWIKTTIGSLFESTIPGDWGESPTLRGSVPVLRSTNIRNDGTLDLGDIAYRSIGEARLRRRLIKAGTLLFEKSGGSPSQPAGRVAYCDSDLGGTASNFIEIARVRPDYDSKYVFYLCFYLYQTGLVLRYQQQTTGIINFKLKEYTREELAVPSDKSEQSQIAKVLSMIDSAIQRTNATVEKQKRIKIGLMQDVLTKGIDEHGSIRSEETHEFKDSPLGRIPVEWDWRVLKELTDKIADRDHTTPDYVADGVVIVSPQSFIDDEGIDFAGCGMITPQAHEINRKKTDVKARDLVLHRIGAGLGQVRLVWEDAPEFSILHSLALVRPDEVKVRPEFLKWAFRSYAVQKQMALGTQSIGVPDLGLEKIAELFLAIPGDKGEQESIAEALERQQGSITKGLEYHRKLIRLKAGLMQDLLTGKVRVTPLLHDNISGRTGVDNGVH